ncbi:MAG: Fur family transcriptional regulator [Acidimicrobiales bacterium]
MHSTTTIVALFRSKGLRITPQRLAIFAALQGDESHPTAPTVYERVAVSMPSISLRTVYQTLNDPCALGVIGSVHLGGDALRFDPNTDEHHHLVCDACGSIADTYLDVGGLQPDADEAFAVHRTRVVLHGTCRACRTGALTG